MRDSYTEDIVPIFCSYSSAIFAAQMKFRRRHPILLPVTAPFCSDVYRARTHLHEAMHLLSPAFRQARHKAQTQNGMDIAIIGWILRNVDEDRYYDDEYLAKLLLAYGIAFIFAASPTGSGIVTEAAFRPDLCSSSWSGWRKGGRRKGWKRVVLSEIGIFVSGQRCWPTPGKVI